MRNVRFGSAITVLVFLLSGFTAGPAASGGVPAVVPMAATSASLTLTGPYVITKGHKATLKAAWAVNGVLKKGKVALQRKYDGGWRTIRTLKLTTGTATTTVKPGVTASYRLKQGKDVSKTRKITVSKRYIKVSSTKKTVVHGKSATLSVKYVTGGKVVKSGKLWLQHYSGGKWKNARSINIIDGKGKVALKPGADKSYRVVSRGVKLKSATVKAVVKWVAPASFTITGSGYGHGIGMSQYGAYQMALNGKTASQILTHYFTGAKVASHTTPKTIAIQIYGPEPYGFSNYADATNSTVFSITDGKWSVRNSGGTSLAGGDSTSTVSLSVNKGNVRATIKDAAGKTIVVIDRAELEMQWNDDAIAKLARANGTYKYGTMTATVIDGRLNIVNTLLFNTEYLYGIAEMPSSWGSGKGAAALQAQAITARSYALEKGKDRKSKCNCNLVDDVRDQNFTGWKKAGETVGGTDYGKIWRDAVDATRTSATKGSTLTYAKKPIATYYFSSSGGRTANSEDVWSAALPWARGVDDPYSLTAPGNSMTEWTRTLTQAKAQELFDLPDVVKIAVSQKYSSGQVKRLTARSASGKKARVTAKADVLRSRLGLPAAWIKSIKG